MPYRPVIKVQAEPKTVTIQMLIAPTTPQVQRNVIKLTRLGKISESYIIIAAPTSYYLIHGFCPHWEGNIFYYHGQANILDL